MSQSKTFTILVEPDASLRRRRGKATALLVAAGLSTLSVASCGPTVVGNPKGCRYDDAGVERCGEVPDAGQPDGGKPDGGQ